MYFLQLDNGYELPINTFVETYNDEFQKIGKCILYVRRHNAINAMTVYFLP
jgi:hypothetical protein